MRAFFHSDSCVEIFEFISIEARAPLKCSRYIGVQALYISLASQNTRLGELSRKNNNGLVLDYPGNERGLSPPAARKRDRC